jgi:tetratricopeptide (TPR) repeat protein
MSRRKHQIEAFFRQGTQLHADGRFAEAEQVYRQLLAAVPSHADSQHMLGMLALQAKQPGIALEWIDRAIAARPANAIYQVNRASALLAIGETAAAEAACREALKLKRNSAEACQVLGHALCDLGRPEEAIAAYRDAMRYNAALPDLAGHLGLALRQAGRQEEAAAALRQAVARAPQDMQALGNLAGVLKELAHPDEAESLYREALRRQPNDPAQHYNLSLALLLAGRFAAGWSEYEWRFRAGAARMPDCRQPRWEGEPLAGRTLLIRSEQGLGDAIQFCRYAPLVTGGHVILEVHRPLCRLLGTLRGIQRVVPIGDPPPPFDLYVPLLSLPRLLDEAATPVPYLGAEPDLVAAWRDRLGSHGFRIGVAWQGNPASLAEHGRSYPLADLRPLAERPGVRLISLQKYHGMEQLADAGFAIETPELDTGPDGFVDTAAVMQSLDLIVTSDTSVAHLAGAMGRPVWVALQHVPDWRWLLAGEDCRWYPTMRLFRQTRRGDWDAVFARMAEQLA